MKETAIDLLEKDAPKKKADPEILEEESGEETLPRKKLFKNKKVKIIALAAGGLIFLGGGIGVASYMRWIPLPWISKKAPPPKPAEAPAPPQPVIGSMVKIDPLTINIKDEKGKHYLKTSIVLEVGRPEWVEEVKANIPLFTDLIILYLSDKGLEDLRNPKAKETLKKEFLTQMNQALGSAKVTRLYFDEYIYQ
jgi:flagellar basal body-associated protein FliL